MLVKINMQYFSTNYSRILSWSLCWHGFRRRKLTKKAYREETCKIKTYTYYQHRQRLWPVKRQTCPPIREDTPWHKYCICLRYSQNLVI